MCNSKRWLYQSAVADEWHASILQFDEHIAFWDFHIPDWPLISGLCVVQRSLTDTPLCNSKSERFSASRQWPMSDEIQYFLDEC